jgi:hypothetical protein
MGLGALCYSVWSYLDLFIYEHGERKAFDRAREGRIWEPTGAEVQAPDEQFRAKLMIARLNLATMVEEGVGEETLSMLLVISQ